MLWTGVYACEKDCGQECLKRGQAVSSCLQTCGCIEEARAALHWEETPNSTCASECLSVCDSEDCVYQCTRNFCATPLPVALDVVLLISLLGLFYFAYMLVPKAAKRGKYWRSRAMETQYRQLEDY